MPLPTPTSYASVGGEKTDYAEVVDPSTDLSFELELNVTRADCAAMTRTAVRAWVQWVAGSAGSSTVSGHGELWGGGSASAPTVARTGTGVYEVTFPASVIDERGNTLSVNLLTDGWATYRGNGALHISTECYEPNKVRVRVFNTSGSSVDGDSIGARITLYAM